MIVGRIGVASGYASYARAYPKNWQAHVAVKKKKSLAGCRGELCASAHQHDRRKQCKEAWPLARTSGHRGASSLVVTQPAASRSPR